MRSLILTILLTCSMLNLQADDRPNVVLVMADDMGWAQTGYYKHPVLKTPNLDAMAAHGLRFDRFYAGAPNCSPTRSTVMTGRSNDRTGVLNHGYAMHRQEKTIAQAMQSAGYATGHFGKWHLNGFSGPGAPIFANDTHNPGTFGFDEWLSVTNFFDRNPLMSRKGEFQEFSGDSSEIIVAEALKFMDESVKLQKPFFTVIWYGSPHSPFMADGADTTSFADLENPSRNHYGELVAMDRSIGALRQGLRNKGLAENTIVWFCSDNGGLPEVKPSSVGHLRGFKNTLYEGGLRVPSIVEWPSVIKKPRITQLPAATFDIFPTIADILNLPSSSMLQTVDGQSLKFLITDVTPETTRTKPLFFRHQGRGAMVDNQWKLVKPKANSKIEIYDLGNDPTESHDLVAEKPEIAERMEKEWLAFSASVDKSQQGADYPEGKVLPGEPGTRPWVTMPEYQAFFDQWVKRPEYKTAIEQFRKPTTKKKKAN